MALSPSALKLSQFRYGGGAVDVNCSAHQFSYFADDNRAIPSTMTLTWAPVPPHPYEAGSFSPSRECRENSDMARLHTMLDSRLELVVSWNHFWQRPAAAGSQIAEHSLGRFTLEVVNDGNQSNLIQVDSDVMRDASAEMHAPEFDSFELSSPPAPDNLKIWQNTATLAVTTMLDLEVPTASIFLHEMPRLVAVTMLSCFPYRHRG